MTTNVPTEQPPEYHRRSLRAAGAVEYSGYSMRTLQDLGQRGILGSQAKKGGPRWFSRAELDAYKNGGGR